MGGVRTVCLASIWRVMLHSSCWRNLRGEARKSEGLSMRAAMRMVVDWKCEAASACVRTAQQRAMARWRAVWMSRMLLGRQVVAA